MNKPKDHCDDISENISEVHLIFLLLHLPLGAGYGGRGGVPGGFGTGQGVVGGGLGPGGVGPGGFGPGGVGPGGYGTGPGGVGPGGFGPGRTGPGGQGTGMEFVFLRVIVVI